MCLRLGSRDGRLFFGVEKGENVPGSVPRPGRVARRGVGCKGGRRPSRSDAGGSLAPGGTAWTLFGRGGAPLGPTSPADVDELWARGGVYPA